MQLLRRRAVHCRRFSAVPRSTELFVRNLPKDATADDVRLLFEACCAVSTVKLPLNKTTRETRGYAFVTVAEDSAQSAVAATQDSVLKGKRVVVEIADSEKVAKQRFVAADDLVKAPEVKARSARERAYLAAQSEMALATQLSDCRSAADVLRRFRSIWFKNDAFNLASSLRRIGSYSRSFDASDTAELRKLVDAAEKSLIEVAKKWDPRELSSAVWGASKITGFKAPVLFDLVANEAAVKLQKTHFSALALSSLVSAFASQRVQAPLLFSLVERAALKKAKDFTAQELSSTVWAYATAGCEAPLLFQKFANVATQKGVKFQASDLATISWAYATLGVSAPSLFEEIAELSTEVMQEFNADGFAHLVWSFATVGADAHDLFQAVAAGASAPEMMKTFSHQNLSNTVWAYATAGVEAPVLFEAVAREAKTRIETLQPQDVAEMAWAFAKTGALRGEEAARLFDAIARGAALHAPPTVALFSAQDLAKTAWAFATARVSAPALFCAIAGEAVHKLERFNAIQLANLAWSFAALRVDAPQLLDAVSDAAVAKMNTFNAPSLANTAFAAIAEEAPKRLEACNPRALSHLVWAFTNAGVSAPALFDELAGRIELRIDDFSKTDLALLHQAHIHTRLESPKSKLARVLQAHVSHLREAPHAAEARKELSGALQDWAHDYATPEGVGIDFARPTEKVALLFDGPERYMLSEETRSLDGSARSQGRILQQLGWRVVRVPSYEWDALDDDGKKEYLREKTTLASSEPGLLSSLKTTGS
ncbi:hypothetical protein M885DRAFT_567043 [Pelagophyceae sp. CCMP2097]|nr:hypothetical protein M885DRAFT_567043 [Pelagophyceae sp. CCMP2097]